MLKRCTEKYTQTEYFILKEENIRLIKLKRFSGEEFENKDHFMLHSINLNSQ